MKNKAAILAQIKKVMLKMKEKYAMRTEKGEKELIKRMWKKTTMRLDMKKMTAMLTKMKRTIFNFF